MLLLMRIDVILVVLMVTTYVNTKDQCGQFLTKKQVTVPTNAKCEDFDLRETQKSF